MPRFYTSYSYFTGMVFIITICQFICICLKKHEFGQKACALALLIGLNRCGKSTFTFLSLVSFAGSPLRCLFITDSCILISFFSLKSFVLFFFAYWLIFVIWRNQLLENWVVSFSNNSNPYGWSGRTTHVEYYHRQKSISTTTLFFFFFFVDIYFATWNILHGNSIQAVLIILVIVLGTT